MPREGEAMPDVYAPGMGVGQSRSTNARALLLFIGTTI